MNDEMTMNIEEMIIGAMIGIIGTMTGMEKEIGKGREEAIVDGEIDQGGMRKSPPNPRGVAIQHR